MEERASTTISTTGLTLLPYQLLLDEVLPFLDVKTLIQLRSVNSAFKAAIDDEVVWRRRISKDFSFPVRSTARTTGWKRLYRGLTNPELYTWGDPSHNRLGLKRIPKFNESGEEINPTGLEQSDLNVIAQVRCVPYPLKVHWKDADLYERKAKIVNANYNNFERPTNLRFNPEISLKLIEPKGRKENHSIRAGVPVEIHSGGWNFFALTQLGQILAWGSSAGQGSSSSCTERDFESPTLLDLNGNRAKSLSVGRSHAIAEMEDESLFEFTGRWDRPAVHDVIYLLSDIGNGNDNYKITQIEAGWMFTTILANSKDSPQSEVLMWDTEWTYSIQQQSWYETATQSNENDATIEPVWPVTVPIVTLPKPPKQFTRIAAGDRFIVALTNDGEVYYLSIPEIRRAGNQIETPQDLATKLRKSLIDNYVQWELLPLFCHQIREAGTSEDGNIWEQSNLIHLLSSDVRITHISAQFKSFAVYAPEAGNKKNTETEEGSGIVLLGSNDEPQKPKIIPELQGIGVIKVVHGDWHSGALTINGEVKTWGSRSNGALGTWDSISIPEGAQSVFSHPIHSAPGLQIGALNFPGMVPGMFRRAIEARRQAQIQMQIQQQQQEERQPAEHDQVRSKEMIKAEKDRYLIRRLPHEIEKPQTVKFGFPGIGERRNGKTVEDDDVETETKFVFDIAFAGWHSGALAIDRSLIFDD